MDGKGKLSGRRKKPGYKNPGEIHQGLTRTKRKKGKEEVWMESGGTGTVTSAVLRDDGLCIMQHYAASLLIGTS